MEWLYCDFHIHTTWSDGRCSVEEVIELYGEAGFDVIAITDHVLDSETAKASELQGKRIPAVSEEDFPVYIDDLRRAARFARERYGMLLIPGVEITNDTSRFHMLCLDIKEYISPDPDVETIIENTAKQQGVSVACHPCPRSHSGQNPSAYLWENHERLAGRFDAWEVANRDDLFSVVGLKKFNYIANSDFHEEKHLLSWKTLLRCEKNSEAVKEAIRSNERVSLFLYRGGRIR